MKVTQTPLTSLRTEAGADLRRERDVTVGDVKKLLSSVVVQFVVADVGSSLRWISEEERFRFWKSEAHVHIAEDEKKSLDDCPAGYFYFASEWRTDVPTQVVILLEKHH